MSSTGRGGQRSEADYYPTPGWCVERLLEEVHLPGGRWIEPSAGDGAIIRAVNDYRARLMLGPVEWTAVELREACAPELRKLTPRVRIGNFLSAETRWLGGGEFDVCIGNPPFRHALDFVHQARLCAPLTLMLLRLGFLATADRAAFMREAAPSVYVLPDRPPFTGKGTTDSSDYAWFLWRRGQSSSGNLRVLATTPAGHRRVRTGAAVAETTQPQLWGSR